MCALLIALLVTAFGFAAGGPEPPEREPPDLPSPELPPPGQTEIFEFGVRVQMPKKVTTDDGVFVIRAESLPPIREAGSTYFMQSPDSPSKKTKLNYVRQIVNLDIYAHEEGKPDQRVPIEATGAVVLVEISFTTEEREIVKLPDRNPKLLFWNKEKSIWQDAIEFILAGYIQELQLSEKGFSFFIREWPIDDLPIGAGD